MSTTKFDENSRVQIRTWVENVTKLKFKSSDFYESLSDGVILCELVCKIRQIQNAQFYKFPRGVLFKEMENIAFFINNCNQIDVKVKWSLRALHENEDMDSVIQTIVNLALRAEQIKPDLPTCPIAAKFSEGPAPTPDKLAPQQVAAAQQPAAKAPSNVVVVKKPVIIAANSGSVVRKVSSGELSPTPQQQAPQQPAAAQTTPTKPVVVVKSPVIVKSPVVVKAATPAASPSPTPAVQQPAADVKPPSPTPAVVVKAPVVVKSPVIVKAAVATPAPAQQTPAVVKSPVVVVQKPAVVATPAPAQQATPVVKSPVVVKAPTVVAVKPPTVVAVKPPTVVAVKAPVVVAAKPPVVVKAPVLVKSAVVATPAQQQPAAAVQAQQTPTPVQVRVVPKVIVKPAAQQPAAAAAVAQPQQPAVQQQSTPAAAVVQQPAVQQPAEVKQADVVAADAKPDEKKIGVAQKVINAVASAVKRPVAVVAKPVAVSVGTRAQPIFITGNANLPNAKIQELWVENVDKVIQKLKDEAASPSAEVLDSIAQVVKKKGKDYSEKLAQKGIMQLLHDILEPIVKGEFKSTRELAIMLQVIRCYKRLCNVDESLVALLKVDDAIKTICTVLVEKEVKTRRKALVVLALSCNFSEDGFMQVVKAMNSYKQSRKEPHRFHDLMLSMRTEDDQKFKACALLLINALINSPQERAARSLMKKEFMQLDVHVAVEEIKSLTITDKTLKTQLKVFEEDILNSAFEDSELEDLASISDPVQLTRLLQLKLGSYTAIINLVNTLQRLLSLSTGDDEKNLLSNWAIIEKMVTRSILPNSKVEDLAYKAERASDELNKQLKTSQELQKQYSELKTRYDQEHSTLISENQSFKALVEKYSKDLSDATQKLDILSNNSANSEVLNKLKELEQETDKLKRLLEEEKTKVAQLHASGTVAATVQQGLPPPPPLPPQSSSLGDGGIALPPPPPMPPMGGPPPPPPPPPPGMGAPPPPPPGMMGGPPPPPPPPGMGGPPPPPPPPGMGGPPPPPGMAPMGGPPPPPAAPALPKIKSRAPKKPTRNFYGEVLPKLKVAQTAWIKDGIIDKMNKVDLDENELEALFTSEAPAEGKTSEKLTQKKPEIVSFVDPQKSTNMSIMLGYLKMSGEEVRDAIISMNDQKIAPQHIEYLKDKAPTSDELNAIQSYNGDLALLSAVDKFYLAIKDIPRLTSRLSAWSFKHKFNSEIGQLKPDLESVSEAARQVLESTNFKELLAVILAITNFLNGNTNKKDSYGFKLSSLGKLKDTKTADNKSNLLVYLGMYCEKKCPHLLNTYQDMTYLEQAMRVSLPDLVSEYGKLKTGVDTAQKELKMMQSSNLVNDKFQEVMESFLNGAAMRVGEIEEVVKTMNERLTNLANAYGEDPQKVKQNPQQIFEIISNFNNNFRLSYEEYKKKKEAEEKKAQQQAKLEEKRKMLEKQKAEKLGKTVEAAKEDAETNAKNEERAKKKKTKKKINARGQKLEEGDMEGEKTADEPEPAEVKPAALLTPAAAMRSRKQSIFAGNFKK